MYVPLAWESGVKSQNPQTYVKDGRLLSGGPAFM